MKFKVKTSTKIALLAAGYLAAFVAAWVITGLYIAITDSPEKQASSGMSAFGDTMMFLFLFGAGCLLPFCATLYFLRPFHKLWRLLSMSMFFISLTSPLALLTYAIPIGAETASVVGMLVLLFPIRFILAFFLGAADLLCAFFAPIDRYRRTFFAATAIEFCTLLGTAFVVLNSLIN